MPKLDVPKYLLLKMLTNIPLLKEIVSLPNLIIQLILRLIHIINSLAN